MNPSIWTGMHGKLPLHDALRTLSTYGWRTFEISSEHLIEIETSGAPEALIAEAQECLKKLDLVAPQAHGLLHANVADPDPTKCEQDIARVFSHIEIAAQLGVKTIVVHPGGKRDATDLELAKILEINIEAFRRIADFASDRGMRIGIENMIYSGNTAAPDIMKLINGIGRRNVGVTLDTSHANMCRQDIPEMIQCFGKHLIATHISDNDGSGDQHRVPGDGTIDWPSVMKALKEIGYDGTLNLEIPGARNRIPEITKLKASYALDVAMWLVSLTAASEDPLP